jgi:hypothetical protein
MPFQEWEYAVMHVDIVELTAEKWTYRARAAMGSEYFYDKTLTDRYWSVPLSDLGRQGWELVGMSTENALMSSGIAGWQHNETSRPVRTNFIFKRPTN